MHKYLAGVAESNAYLGKHKTGDRYQTDIRQADKHTDIGVYRVAPQLKTVKVVNKVCETTCIDGSLLKYCCTEE